MRLVAIYKADYKYFSYNGPGWVFITVKSSLLLQTYGDYFLAEMIEAQDESNHSLVAEVNGKAIGYMSICADVNIQLLQVCFWLNLGK